MNSKKSLGLDVHDRQRLPLPKATASGESSQGVRDPVLSRCWPRGRGT